MHREKLLYYVQMGSHPSIPVIPRSRGFGEDHGYRYLVMPRLGASVKDLSKQHGPWSLANVSLLALQAVRAAWL